MSDPTLEPPADPAGPSDAASVDPSGDPARSGLRDPQKAVRGVGAGSLVLEALVLLLALAPLAKLGGLSALGATALLGLVVLCVLTAGALRRPWGWRLGTAVQVGVLATGFLHVALLVLGILFAGIWVYVLRLRVTLSRPPVRRAGPAGR